jgi:hypothetical protein
LSRWAGSGGPGGSGILGRYGGLVAIGGENHEVA